MDFADELAVLAAKVEEFRQSLSHSLETQAHRDAVHAALIASTETSRQIQAARAAAVAPLKAQLRQVLDQFGLVSDELVALQRQADEWLREWDRGRMAARQWLQPGGKR